MSQTYSDPSRANDPNALPNVETFYMDNDDGIDADENGEAYASGWYWWSCFPGCLPDGEPMGPFDTEEEVIADAQSGNE